MYKSRLSKPIRYIIGTFSILSIVAADTCFVVYARTGYWYGFLAGSLAATGTMLSLWWMRS